MTRIVPAIMAGGAGERLWPVSTDAHPKQFRALVDAQGATLFQSALERMRGLHGDVEFGTPIVVCNVRHGALALEQARAMGIEPAAIVLEPIGRNTAAVAVIAAALATEISPGALVLLAPADHLIENVAAFHEAAARAAPVARARIVTFGITPTRAETGYGYIESGEALAPGVHAIRRFHEKPDAQQAARYLASGAYSWNAGMFLYDPDVLLSEFAKTAPGIRDKALAALQAATRDGGAISPSHALFAAIPAEPVDKALMEKTALGAVAPCDVGWADLGSWAEVWRLSSHDAHGNHVAGEAVLIDAARNLIRSDGKLVAVAGISDLIVVVEGDVVLIVPRERAQDVKKLCAAAKKD
jgi:mannose-1-phosphate guanylyltransferase/mannose-6-phosphate isomerase